LLINGECLITSIKKQVKIKKNENHITFLEEEQTVVFRSKAVVISNGGRQAMYANFYKDFPFMSERKDRVLLAGTFLKKDLFKQTMAMIKE